MNVLTLQRLLLDGLLYSAILGVAIVASLYWNPRLWIQDLPAQIRARVAPLTAREKRDRSLFGAVFMLLVLGLPIWMAAQLKAQNGGVLSFGEAYLYVFSLLMAFNLFDAVIIDWLLLTVLHPSRLTVQGAEAMIDVLHDPMFHLSGFLKGVVFSAVGSLILTAVTLLF